MGRELKRVPLDFKWSNKQVWKGYINPYRSLECKSCEGSGLNPATKKISDDWYSHLRNDGKKGWSNELTEVEVEALVRSGRLGDLMENNCYFDDEQNKWMKWVNREKIECEQPKFPTPEQVNEWSKKGFGHDAINHWVCTKARAKSLGVYGHCEFCDGGEIWQSEEIKKLHNEWKQFEPPIGEGFQLWETTSEGSPSSPVFKTLDELCQWCAENATTFASYTATKEEWMKMLDDGMVTAQEGNAVFI